MNKSKVARDFWRKVFNDNLIDLHNSDKRKEIVNEFFANPENKKLGWHPTKDRRQFRLAFNHIAKENKFNVHDIGIKPTPKVSKSVKGSMNISAKTDEKKVHPLFNKPDKPDTEKVSQAVKQPIPNTQQLTEQAVQYSAQSIGSIFETMFRIMRVRFPEISELSHDEKIAMGEAWSPIFNTYLQGNSIWVMPMLITAPIVLTRVAQISKAKKEKEIAETYGLNEQQFKEATQEKPEEKSRWKKMDFGKDKTNQR